MKTLARTFVLGCLLLLTTAAQASEEIKQHIQGLHQEMDQAFAAFDAEGFAKHLSPEFSFLDEEGETVTRAQLVQQAGLYMKQLKSVGGTLESKTEVRKIKVEGSEKVEVETFTTTTIQAGDDQQVSQESRLETWIHNGEAWHCVSGKIINYKEK